MKDFIVGSEIKLKNILEDSDVIPLLKGMITTGIQFASVTDEKGLFLWTEGGVKDVKGIPSSIMQDIAKTKYEGKDWRSVPLHNEGEPIGFLFVSVSDSINEVFLGRLMEITSVSLKIILKNVTKRMFVTELHDSFTHQSYEELLETNRRLTVSENKYRELVQTLEQKVQEKTMELKKTYTKLLEQAKMASIGQLAAGIAHEINNPIGFITSNLNTLSRYVSSLKEMIEFYRNSLKGTDSELPSENVYKRLKIDFIMDDVFDLIQQNLEGSERIKRIVASLKDFSHVDETTHRHMDINAEIENTINVLSHDIKSRSAKIIKDYGHIKNFYGNPKHICQLFLNILLNAIQARDKDSIVTIRTEQSGDNTIISIADNGRGIPPDIRERIFEPFFTTKDVGAGTGMGLAVSYDIVTAHGGTIEVKSEVGKGSTFIISLPCTLKKADTRQ